MEEQVFLGGGAFWGGLIDHLRKRKDIREIPRNQRFVNRPELGKILNEGVLRDRGRRNQKVEEGVERYRYTQREVADFLGLHFTPVSRIMAQRINMQRK